MNIHSLTFQVDSEFNVRSTNSGLEARDEVHALLTAYEYVIHRISELYHVIAAVEISVGTSAMIEANYVESYA
jgi:hypothetical protein